MFVVIADIYVLKPAFIISSPFIPKPLYFLTLTLLIKVFDFWALRTLCLFLLYSSIKLTTPFSSCCEFVYFTSILFIQTDFHKIPLQCILRICVSWNRTWALHLSMNFVFLKNVWVNYKYLNMTFIDSPCFPQWFPNYIILNDSIYVIHVLFVSFWQTFIGDIFLLVNPFKELPIYSTMVSITPQIPF